MTPKATNSTVQSDNISEKKLRKLRAETQDTKLNGYISSFVRNEMKRNLDAYLNGMERAHENKDGHDIPIGCNLKKVVNLTAHYRSGKNIGIQKINKITDCRRNNTKLNDEQKAIAVYQSAIYLIARKAYLMHLMAARRIEQYCLKKRYDESVCLFAQLQYFIGVEVPDERGRLFTFGSNKGSLKLIDYLALCVRREDSPRYMEKFRRQHEKRLQKEIAISVNPQNKK